MVAARLIRLGLLLLLLTGGESAPGIALAQIAPLHRERQAIIVQAYRAALGRAPSAAELYYWELYPETPPGVITAHALFAVLLQTLRNSPTEREATARRALDAVFGPEEIADPRLRAYIDDGRNPPMRQALADLAAERGGGGYRGLVAWLSRPEVRGYFAAITGIAALRAGAAR
jgi:hypothetical protein